MPNEYIIQQLELHPYDPLTVKDIKIEMWGYRFAMDGTYMLPSEEWGNFRIECIGCTSINIKYTLPQLDERLNEVEIITSSFESNPNGAMLKLFLENVAEIEICCAETLVKRQA